MRTVAKSPLDILRGLDAIPGLPECWYVYFLWDDTRLVYVGSTTNVLARLGQHTHEGKRFSRATYAAYASEEDMRTAEALYINKHKPPLNKRKHYASYARCSMPIAVPVGQVVAIPGPGPRARQAARTE